MTNTTCYADSTAKPKRKSGEPLSKRIPLLELGPDQCRWATMHYGKWPTEFCGHPQCTIGGKQSSYCRYHHELATREKE